MTNAVTGKLLDELLKPGGSVLPTRTGYRDGCAQFLRQAEGEIVRELLPTLGHIVCRWVAGAKRAVMGSLAHRHPPIAHILKAHRPDASLLR